MGIRSFSPGATSISFSVHRSVMDWLGSTSTEFDHRKNMDFSEGIPVNMLVIRAFQLAMIAFLLWFMGETFVLMSNNAIVVTYLKM